MGQPLSFGVWSAQKLSFCIGIGICAVVFDVAFVCVGCRRCGVQCRFSVIEHSS